MPTPSPLPPQIEQFLHDNPQGVLTSFRRNGMPQLSIVTVYPRDGGVGISITETRAKFRNLLRDPRCSVLVSHVDWWSGFLVFEGRAELVHSGNTDPDALRLARRHIFSATTRRRSADWEQYDRIAASDKRVAMVVRPDHIYGSALAQDARRGDEVALPEGVTLGVRARPGAPHRDGRHDPGLAAVRLRRAVRVRAGRASRSADSGGARAARRWRARRSGADESGAGARCGPRGLAHARHRLVRAGAAAWRSSPPPPVSDLARAGLVRPARRGFVRQARARRPAGRKILSRPEHGRAAAGGCRRDLPPAIPVARQRRGARVGRQLGRRGLPVQ